MTTTAAPDLARLARDAKAQVDIGLLIGARVPLRGQGDKRRGPCPFHGGKGPNLSVMRAAGRYRCHVCDAAGDAVDWLRFDEGLDFAGAVARLAAIAGMHLPEGLSAPGGSPAASRARANLRAVQNVVACSEIRRKVESRDLYARARPAVGSPVVRYLAEGRGIPLDRLAGIDRRGRVWTGLPPSLRYLPALFHSREAGRLPAMLAPFQDAGGAVTGVHATFLARDSSAKAPVAPAKKMYGLVGGAAIRFGRPGRVLLLAEGIETGLSVLAALCDGDTVPTLWVTGSLEAMAGPGLGRGDRHPLHTGRVLPSPRPDLGREGLAIPPEVEEIWIAEDADGDAHVTPPLQDRAAARYRRLGFTVRRLRPPAGMDWNDVLRGQAVGGVSVPGSAA